MERDKCGHRTCLKLRKRGASYSAAVLALLRYKKGRINEQVFGLGRELGGTYAGQYNLCAGKGEPDDFYNGVFCWLRCCQREFFEEFKQYAPFEHGTFDSYFKGRDGQIRVVIFKRTPIFIASMPTGTSRATIRAKMHRDNHDRSLSYSHKEMDDFEWFRVSDGCQIEGRDLPVSVFARDVRNQIIKFL